MSDFRTTFSSIFIGLLLNLVWMNKSLCNEIAFQSHRTQLECVYNLATGGKICDCQSRNMVIFLFYEKKKKPLLILHILNVYKLCILSKGICSTIV